MDLQLINQIAVLPGGAKGIGLATAQLFLEEGAKVAIWDRSTFHAPDFAEKMGVSSDRILSCVIDVTSKESLQLACDRTLSAFGLIQHVVRPANELRRLDTRQNSKRSPNGTLANGRGCCQRSGFSR